MLSNYIAVGKNEEIRISSANISATVQAKAGGWTSEPIVTFSCRCVNVCFEFPFNSQWSQWSLWCVCPSDCALCS